MKTLARETGAMLEADIAVRAGATARDARAPSDWRTFARGALLFALIGTVLYAAVYAWSEQLIGRYARRNRFHAIHTAPAAAYDAVILGASHGAALGYGDLTARLEELTASRILNLAIPGAGVTVNRLLLEYFLVRHSTASVVYVIDSFVFYSPQWNEERLRDVRLFHRAPFDPDLARLLLRGATTRRTGLDYLLGFSKINNADRFKPDLDEAEATGRFERTYRPVPQIDEQRLAYLYPPETDVPSHAGRYLTEFEDLIRLARSRGIRVVAIKPPIPERIYRRIKNEAQFDGLLTPILRRQVVEFHDFSLAGNDPRFFFDSDHLNRTGTLNFFEHHLRDLLKR